MLPGAPPHTGDRRYIYERWWGWGVRRNRRSGRYEERKGEKNIRVRIKEVKIHKRLGVALRIHVLKTIN